MFFTKQIIIDNIEAAQHLYANVNFMVTSAGLVT